MEFRPLQVALGQCRIARAPGTDSADRSTLSPPVFAADGHGMWGITVEPAPSDRRS